MKNKEKIIVQTSVNSNIKIVWNTWTDPKHIRKWNTASKDWHTTKAENNLTEGGRFTSRMEAKDGSMGFDFSGIYTQVTPNKYIAYFLDDNRKVTIEFKEEGDTVKIIETFEAEGQNSIDMQRDGWQEILNNFKKYTESL